MLQRNKWEPSLQAQPQPIAGLWCARKCSKPFPVHLSSIKVL